MPRYWLTPPDLYQRLDARHHFDFDPAPYPLPSGFDGLRCAWGQSNYVNPPRREDCVGVGGRGPTRWVHKAISEHQAYHKGSVLILPVASYVNLLLEAGAEVQPLGRVPWMDVDTGERWKAPCHVAAFILKP